jgi:hypothetical protein
MNTKLCTYCDLNVDISLFVPGKNYKDGLHPWCRPCRTTYINNLRKGVKKAKKIRTHKTCIKCKFNKPLVDFSLKDAKRNYYRSACKNCDAIYHRQHRLDNPEKYKKQAQKVSEKLKALTAARKALEPQPKEGHKFCSECKEEKLFTIEFFAKSFVSKSGLSLRCLVCHTKEKQKKTKRRLSDKYQHQFCNHCDRELPFLDFKTESGGIGRVCKVCRVKSEKTNLEKMFNHARSRLRNFLFSENERYSEEIGCTNKELRIYIEKQFIKKMCWDNYGFYWNLDHYYPLSQAYKHGEEAYAKARHYTNIRPVRCRDNFSKHNHVPKEYRKAEEFLKGWERPKPVEKVIKPFSWDD